MNARVPRSPARPPRVPRLSVAAWREQHLYAALSSLGRLVQRPGATASTAGVLALALALPLLLLLTLRNLDGVAGSLDTAMRVAVFLEPGLDAKAVEAVRARIAELPVTAIDVRTPREALDELAAIEGFDDARALLEAGDFPHLLLVEPREGEAQTLAAALARLPHVDLVQSDVYWRGRLDALRALAARCVLVAAVLFGLGGLLLVGHTVRLEVRSRSEEIAVATAMGASPGFVRRPFLYAGIWYGLLGGLLALGLALAARAALATPAAALAERYGSAFRLLGPDLALAATVLAAGLVLGWIGAFAACGRALARGLPP